jgi:hypothetical protein
VKARANNRERDIQRTPPHSVEAEQGVLGSMLQEHGGKEAIAEAAAQLRPEHFYVPKHQTVFTTICDLYDEGAPTDFITLTNRLRDQKLLESVGGAAFVTGLVNFVPTAVNVEYYIDIVREKYVLRQAVAAGTELVRRAHEEQDNPLAVWDEIESKVASIRSVHGRNGEVEFTVRPAAEILKLKLDEHDCLMGDRLLAKTAQLVIAGAAGIGKSRLHLQLAAACITGRDCCGFETHAKGLRWLILQTENSNRRLQDDLRALARKFGKDFLDLLFIHTIETDSDGFVALDDPTAVRNIEAAIRKYQPDIIGIDPLGDLGIGNLDTDADMRATCRVLNKVCRTGNPQRALVIVHHAITGKAGAAKATGWERSGFARNSKALLAYARGQINIAPGSPDNNDTLVIACGKNNLGKEFSTFAVRLNPDTMIYEVELDFDIEGWRQEITGGNQRRVFSPKVVAEIDWPQRELEKKALAKLVMDEVGCAKSRAYSLIDDAVRHQSVTFKQLTRTYAKK